VLLSLESFTFSQSLLGASPSPPSLALDLGV
jgi:hypothetical protein